MILEFLAQQAIGGLIGAGAVHLGRSAVARLLRGLFAEPPPDVGKRTEEVTNALRAAYGPQGEGSPQSKVRCARSSKTTHRMPTGWPL